MNVDYNDVNFYFVPRLFVLLFVYLIAVLCPKISVPVNGGVVPASCSQADVESGMRCVFFCNDGYELSGPRYSTCQSDRSWSDMALVSCVKGKNKTPNEVRNHVYFHYHYRRQHY